MRRGDRPSGVALAADVRPGAPGGKSVRSSSRPVSSDATVLTDRRDAAASFRQRHSAIADPELPAPATLILDGERHLLARRRGSQGPKGARQRRQRREREPELEREQEQPWRQRAVVRCVWPRRYVARCQLRKARCQLRKGLLASRVEDPFLVDECCL